MLYFGLIKKIVVLNYGSFGLFFSSSTRLLTINKDIILDMGEWRGIVDLGQNQYCILSIGPIKVSLFKKKLKIS